MSRWETISVKHPDSTESFTRFTSSGSVERVLVGSTGCQFDGDTFWLCHDVMDAYHITMSDTSNMGTVRHIFTDEEWSVMRHDDSLWTFDVTHGPQYEWHEDKLATLPDWVTVGGNWSDMD